MKRWAADMKRSDTSLWPWERNWEGVEWKDRCIVLSPAIFGLILDAFFSAVYCWSSLCQSWSKTLAKSTMNIIMVLHCIWWPVYCVYYVCILWHWMTFIFIYACLWFSCGTQVSKKNMPKFNHLYGNKWAWNKCHKKHMVNKIWSCHISH